MSMKIATQKTEINRKRSFCCPFNSGFSICLILFESSTGVLLILLGILTSVDVVEEEVVHVGFTGGRMGNVGKATRIR
jgi:hypothetical protein